MRPNSTIVERQGNLGGQRIEMSFDQNSLAHLMSVMTDLYSDPELAVIREYSTNALDAQIAAGVSRPIEVSTPNGLSPFFKVKDYGIGMDADDITNIYSQYGASTKRETDNQVGMLGLGCKSALSYTQQFVLNSVKDGIRYQVAISRTETGSGVMEIVSETETDDPNGVEIVVPAKRGNDFSQKAKRFFSFWTPGTILLNGEEPTFVSGNKVTDKIMMVEQLDSDYLVMGNVSYPLDRIHRISEANYYNKYSLVVQIEIGDVNFTPSRESLHYTALTEKTLDEIRKDFKEALKTAIQNDVENAETHIKALEAYASWAKMMSNGYKNYMPKVQYRGLDLPDFISHPFLTYDVSATRYAVDSHSGMGISGFKDTPVIYGFPGEKISGHQREKIRLWRTANGYTSTKIIICDELPKVLTDNPWVSDEKMFSWDDVKKTKLAADRSARPKPVFDVFAPGATRLKSMSVEDIPDDKNIALVTPRDMPNTAFMRKFTEHYPDTYVVRLQQYRWEKFQRDNTGTKTLTDLIKEMYTKTVDALTEADKYCLSINHAARERLRGMDETDILDPEMVKAIKAAKDMPTSDTLKAYEDMKELVSKFGYVRDAVDEKNNPLENYPLAQYSYYYNSRVILKHVVLYINAVYLDSLV